MSSASPSTRRLGARSLAKRLLVLALVIVVYRIGVSIPAPGAGQDLASLSSGENGTLNLFNLFAGGPLTRASIFALGVTPFITASIAMQLLESVVPAIKEAKRQGKSGTRRVNAITRSIAIVLALVQSVSSAVTLQGTSSMFSDFSFVRIAVFSLSLTVGFLILLWLAEIVTRHGVGSGVTMLLLVSILSGVWDTSSTLIEARGMVVFLFAMLAIIVVALVVVMFSRAERRVPIVHASRFDEDTKHLSYLPFKVLHAGVAPVIFATSLMSVLASVLGWVGQQKYADMLHQPSSVFYMAVLSVLILAFARLYERTSADPVDMANDLMKDSSFIPGVRPGWSTAKLVENTSVRLALVASLVLIPVALMQSLSSLWFDLPFLPIAGTSLLIIVTAVLDTVRQASAVSTLYSYEDIK